MLGINESWLTKRAGQIIFVKTTLSLWFSFMKMLSLPTAMPPDAYWISWEHRFLMLSKSHRRQFKSKLPKSQKSERHLISSLKGRRPASLRASFDASEPDPA